MASDLREQIERVQSKTRVLGEKYSMLRASYDKARQEIGELKSQVLARDEAIEQLKLKVEYLTVSAAIQMDGSDLAETRAMVADLIKELDRSISDLLE